MLHRSPLGRFWGCLFLVSLCFLNVAFSLVPSAGSLRELDGTEFGELLGKQNLFVKFYAEWCGFCKQIAGVFTELAEEAKDLPVVVAKLNADTYRDYNDRFSIKGFPTILYFEKGSTQPIPYEGDRSLDDMLSFIRGKTGTSGKKKESTSNVVVVDGRNFDRLAKTQHMLVMFYADWCGHCKNMKNDYEKLAYAMKRERKVTIAKVDCPKNDDLCSKFDVKGYPTLKFFSFSTEPKEDYKRARDLKNMLSFVNEKAGTHRLENGDVSEEYGRDSLLEEIVKKFLDSKEDRSGLIATANKTVASILDQSPFGSYAKHYVTTMARIAEKGASYVSSELTRLTKMITEGKVPEEKVDDFMARVNILKVFSGDLLGLGSKKQKKAGGAHEDDHDNEFDDDEADQDEDHEEL